MKSNTAINPNTLKSFDSYVDTLYPIDCGLGSNPLGAPDSVTNFWMNYECSKIDRYYDFSQIVELSVKVGEYTGIPPERIYFSNGSVSMLSNIFFKLFSERPKHMIGIGPQFVQAVSEWLLSGGTYDSIPLEPNGNLDEAIDLLIQKIKTVKPAVVYIDNPNNPTGMVFTVRQIKRLLEVCRGLDVFLVLDEAYADYLPMEASGMNLTNEFQNFIVTRTFSKGLGMASIRIGYCVVHEKLVGSIQKIICPFTLSRTSIEMACYVLPGIESFLLRSREHIRGLKKEMIKAFQQKGITIWPSHSDIPIFLAHHPETSLFTWLSNLGIVTESGKHFTATHPLMNDYYCRIRVPDSKTHLIHLMYRLTKSKL